MRRAADAFAAVVTALFLGLLSWQAYALAARSIGAGELSPGYVSFPVYVFKALFCFGCFVALLETLRQFVRGLLDRPDQTEDTVSTTHF